MLLSIIVPEAPLGMARMLERELRGIESEVIVTDWKVGVPFVRGDFVCLLEADSAIEKGSIINNLKVFMENPSYRKLAMVASPVDYPNYENVVYSFTEDAQKRFENHSDSVHAIRVGSVPGAVIRRSSLQKVAPKLGQSPMDLTMQVCLAFWEHGLRILLNPDSLYYAPDTFERPSQYSPSWSASPNVLSLWQRELIA